MLEEQVKIVVEGVDGSRWVIHGPDSPSSPVRLMEGQLSEFMDAPFSTVYRGVSGKAGKDFRAVNYAERNLVLNLNIAGESGRDWASTDSRFRRAFDAERAATLHVYTKLSGHRWMQVRLGEAPELQNTIDPHEQHNAQFQYVLVAGDPYWYGQEITSEFVFDGSNWFGDGVTMSNPGDVPAWPKWVLTAPAKYGLPDIDFSTPLDERLDRFVYLPFQPTGRAVAVDTDPFEEMITANDGTLLWAKMNGQYFMNPLPPHLLETKVPVYVDPFPLLPFDLPTTWRIWIAEKLRDLVTAMGLDEFLALTPEDIGGRITEWLNGATPEWLEPISPEWLHELTGEFIAKLIRETYDRIGNIAGATAQVRIQPRWYRPWGGDY